METTVFDNLEVRPNIGLVNKYANKARHVAIRSIRPIYFGDANGPKIRGFLINIEGPPNHVSYFRRLIDEAQLKIS